MKPNPSISGGAGYETAPESPYLFTLDFSLPIETAGKRGYRIAEATRLSQAARLQVAETAWTVRSAVRAAVVDLVFATETVAALRTQQDVQNRYADLLQARFTAGEIPQPEVTAARIDLTNVRQALRSAEGQVETSRAALAAAIGIPLSALADKNVKCPEMDRPPSPSALGPAGARTEAVENRLNVQRALAQYEAAQSRLQLEVARQYPDLNLGPGYAFEEGAHLISLQLGTILPLRNRNEGPIAEAEAQRKTAGARLLAAQSAVIAETDKALAQYKAAFAVLEEAQKAKTQVMDQQKTTYSWLQSGEADQLAAASADIQAAAAERSRLEALRQSQIALGALEDALQRPIDPTSAPALPNRPPR
jgi:cobalt-zinc-cadmium efflux system outer membrane protein